MGDPQLFGRVAVVMGGQSAEREISLRSGRQVLDALCSRGVDAVPVDGIPALLDALRAGHFARVFNMLHGGAGESGELQGALEALGIPYTGSGVLGCALSLDKVRSKKVWQASGLPTPAFAAIEAGDDAAALAAALGLPLIVKPSLEGSSLGIRKIVSMEELDGAIADARQYAGVPMLERYVEGAEFTVVILGESVLPSVRIIPRAVLYDFDAKYEAADTAYVCPGLDGEAEQALRALAWEAFRALDCSGWGRVDVMRDAQGQLHLLEVNTAPGMTTHSLGPKAAEAVGLSFADLVWRVLEQTL
jgi:D-alanine-D-alanine ligase